MLVTTAIKRSKKNEGCWFEALNGILHDTPKQISNHYRKTRINKIKIIHDTIFTIYSNKKYSVRIVP